MLKSLIYILSAEEINLSAEEINILIQINISNLAQQNAETQFVDDIPIICTFFQFILSTIDITSIHLLEENCFFISLNL